MYIVSFVFNSDLTGHNLFKSRMVCAEQMTSEVIEKFIMQMSENYKAEIAILNIIKLDDNPKKKGKK